MLGAKRKSVEEGEQLVAALASDHRGAALAAPDRAMLDYAVKLTRTPGEMSPGDVAALRAQGFDDRAIHDLCAVTAYYAFVNRIADGLGVDAIDTGMPMELVLRELYQDDDHIYVTWSWKPVNGGGA